MPDSSPAQLGLLFFRSCCLFGQNGGGTGAELLCTMSTDTVSEISSLLLPAQTFRLCTDNRNSRQSVEMQVFRSSNARLAASEGTQLISMATYKTATFNEAMASGLQPRWREPCRSLQGNKSFVYRYSSSIITTTIKIKTTHGFNEITREDLHQE